MNFARAIDGVISQHLAALQKPGVLSVRPGYAAVGGWLTRKPSIVVTVEQKRDDVPAADRLPETLGGFPVDVRQAGPLLKMRAGNPTLAAAVRAAARPELTQPDFPLERDLTGAAPAAPAAAAHAPAKPQLPYAGPPSATLDAVRGTMTIHCHASPDAGWPTLKAFLAGTREGLTVGMYDFTSAHILDAVTGALDGKRLNLVLDHPAPNPTRDQTDDQTAAALGDALGGRLAFAWALERNDPHAAAWIFPNAYHIKVAVRDHTTFWLSSGNWNNSNQPDIDPLTDPGGAAPVARHSDRDWHVIVEHAGLADVFEKYLLNDLAVAGGHQGAAAGGPSAEAALGALAAPPLPLAPRVPARYFPPRTITADMVIQPLLTPDNYADVVLPLIQSARRSFYMQTQYIHPSDAPGNVKLAALIEAIVQRIDAGVEVKLIMSQYETLEWLELVQGAGISLDHVRVQAGVHNKGMVIDSRVVVVSSQNWSGDGVARNRDAGLIIYNEAAAKYWEEIFLHDWTRMATQAALDSL